MAFNYQKLVQLHRMSGETQTEFSAAIFGKSKKMELRYFDRPSISTQHLEMMCLHYHVPMETFFDTVGLPSVSSYAGKGGIGIGNFNAHDHSRQSIGAQSEKITLLEQQLESANKQVDYLQEQNRTLSEILRSVTVGTQKSHSSIS